MSDSLKEAWKEFRDLFIAAYHNPIARRCDIDPYQIACREAFDKLDLAMSGNVASPDDLQKGLAMLQSLNAAPALPWVVKAMETGVMIDADSPEAQNVCIGNRPALDVTPKP